VEVEPALAEFALAPDPTWTRERLLEALRNAWEHRVPLRAPLPVHLLYLTAAADADGAASFTGDTYGWDGALLDRLGSDPAAASR
jgi:murein L,D-transpeptidase YcbB/YkuD